MTDLTADSRTLLASDGYPLNIATWTPASPPSAQVVLLHGVQSHSGWYQNLGSVLASRGFHVSFPIDAAPARMNASVVTPDPPAASCVTSPNGSPA